MPLFQEFSDKLEGAAHGLHSTLDKHASLAAAGNNHAVPAADIVNYAHKLRMTTFAALGSTPAEPPAPQHWHMQVG